MKGCRIGAENRHFRSHEPSPTGEFVRLRGRGVSVRQYREETEVLDRVQACLRMHFGVVLDWRCNALHRDHFHCDLTKRAGEARRPLMSRCSSRPRQGSSCPIAGWAKARGQPSGSLRNRMVSAVPADNRPGDTAALPSSVQHVGRCPRSAPGVGLAAAGAWSPPGRPPQADSEWISVADTSQR